MTRALALLVLAASLAAAQIPGAKAGRVLLPNGWWLSPAGTQIPLGDLPMNAALSPDERYLAVSHSGQSKAELRLIDLRTNTEISRIRLADAWYGLRFVEETLYVSGGYQNCVYVFAIEAGTLVARDTIRFAEPNPAYIGAAAGLDVRDGMLAVVFRQDSTLRTHDLRTGQQSTVRLTGMPYDCAFLPDGSLGVTLWSSARFVVYRQGSTVYECATGQHPNEITVSPDGRYAYIACANDNTVSVIDLKEHAAVASVGTAIHPDAPEGSTTNSVAVVPGKSFVVAANADNNSLTVISVKRPDHPKPVGFIPVGWYPTKVIVKKDGTLLVLNGKGGRSLPNPKRQYIASLLPGSLSIIPFPSEKKLVAYSKEVFRNTPYRQSELLKPGIRSNGVIPAVVGGTSPIKHVLYIIRENRTYDQVFGDMPQGNGDSSLCLFGEAVTPNAHKIARQFALLDNFYVNAEVSADGHNWSVGGYATDFVEKSWPTQYGGRGGEYVFEGTEPTGWPAAGFLWSAALRKGVSVRSYGEFITASDTIGQPGTPRDPKLAGHFDPLYRGWDLEYSDVDRYKEWEREYSAYEKNGDLPQLCVMHLPNDHTAGAKKGALTPSAYVAQNDYALGLIVQRIARSPYWKETAIFVVEDDAQNGPDHIDAHRSTGLVISPYTEGHGVDHTLYTTASMLRTIELILGIPPMSQYDASATPMHRLFAKSPAPGGYAAEEPRVSLEARNTRGTMGEELMKGIDLRREDAAPDRLFSEIIWRAVKGTPMPAPRYTIFSRAAAEEDGD